MRKLTIEVVAFSRLHFGMFSFGRTGVRQFGGVGTMVGPGSLRIRFEPAPQFVVAGPLAERARKTVKQLVSQLSLGDAPACRVEIEGAPDEHVGLGTGTQLALSITAGLNAFLDGQALAPERLAALAGRGARSAIGTYGFVQGGLLVDRGKLEGETLSPLETRVELPTDWRFVLVRPCDERGLSGEEEQRAFHDLPPVPADTTERLTNEVETELLPAARFADFPRFSESLYRFGREAGLCFAARQGGAFASPRVAELVGLIRSLGVHGAGQSSWGPTVFALVENQSEADRFQQEIARRVTGEIATSIVAPDNHGATITVREA